MFEHLTVLRDCKAITIPYGETITLKEGDEVVITQALGGSYTLNYHGQLLRVGNEDSDALGKPALIATSKENTADHEVNFVQLYEQLKSCYDPEIPINIVELGLIYDVNCYQLIDGRNLVRITMTLTATGCAMGTVIADEIKRKCLALANVDKVEVAIVFDPPWSYEMVSDAAKLQLGLL
ncbi:aromatic ring hydroxylating enzyme [Psychromonas ingrahamii 37]|uniref:Aromatic ring hydroxylating enzyme n=1 Tax=Psychromonas ingrahamii (strain DSM 17664 / CCUG 51855 / 37) TaxID=357804 RepID=A1SV01_PSYIN|nr:putative Fe-S cluster assembly protein SufT [Psychromonas ingrahamii]ABM03316.1 aromatic ring hydroxylating enzyme [Psychromonas ingrahamii 37]